MNNTIDLSNCTLQEALDYAVKQLVAQGTRCLDPCESNCLYLDHDSGNRCAIGWLLPDEALQELGGAEMGVSELVTYARRNGIELPPVLLNAPSELLSRFQMFHDTTGKNQRGVEARWMSGNFGIDTSGKHWQQWINLGEDFGAPIEED